MTAAPAATTAESVEAPDSTAPRLDPAEACGTLTTLVAVIVTTAGLVGPGGPVSPPAGELAAAEGVTVTGVVNGTEMFIEPPGVGTVWK
jgi:hypothetical protein